MRLRKLETKDALGMLEWMRDPDNQKCFRFNMGAQTLEDVNAFILDAQKEGEKNIHLAIVNEVDEYLGTISLKDIDLLNRTAEYAISLRKCAKGKGIGAEATMRLLHIAFEEMELQKVYLNVLADNESAIKLYEKVGFVFEGEFRKHLFLHGEYKNLKWYSILKEEYQSICLKSSCWLREL